MTRMASRTFQACIVLTLVGMGTQLLPFLGLFPPYNDLSVMTLPTLPGDLRDCYGTTEFLTAKKYNGPLVTGELIRIATLFPVLLALISSGIGNRLEAKYGRRRGRWPVRFSFFFIVYLALYLSGIPYRVAAHFHCAAYGITAMDLWTWLGVIGLGLPVPLLLFVFKYTLVFCCMHIFRRRWWLAAAISVFVVFHAAPEIMTNRPMTPARQLVPMENGPYRNHLKKIAKWAGIRLDIMVEDHSKRSNAVNVYLGGRASNRYVVFTDTFMQHFSPQEAGIALAHELGHKDNELTAMAAGKFLNLLKLLLGFLLAFILTGRKKIAPGDGLQTVPIVILCMLFSINLFRPVSNALSRWDEAKSDHYCLELTQDTAGFRILMLKLAKINLEPIDLGPCPYYFFSRYPRVTERLAYADAFECHLQEHHEPGD